MLVLGVARYKGGFVGAPRGETKLTPGDTATLYGPRTTLQNLDERRASRKGNWDHHVGVDKQRQEETLMREPGK